MFLGILFGTITGLTPGIHTNIISAFAVSLSAAFLGINPIYFVVFIVSLSITHTFVDFIPSVLIGCPDTDTELSVLPGHKMLQEGFAYEAILFTCYGSLAAVFVLLIIFLPSVFIIPRIYSLISLAIPYILIAVSLLLVFSEKNKFNSLFVFLLAGFLGFLALNLNENSDKFILPLLSGLFGSSTLIISIKNKTKISEQIIKKPERFSLKPVLISSIVAPVCSLLPGLGTGQAAIVGSRFSRTNEKNFLILLGATNTIVMGFSFISLYIISKTRTGSAVAINELLGGFSINILSFIMLIVLISGIFSFFITKKLALIAVEKIQKINYIKLSVISLAVLSAIVFVLSGPIGFSIFLVSTITGIYCISLNVRRTQMMSALLLPTILFYFGFSI